MPQLSEKLEKWFTVLALLLSTGALLPLFRQESGAVTDATQGGDPVAQLIWIGVYVFAALFVAARWRLFVYVATRDKLLLLLVGLALASVLWSVAPEVTLRRSFALVGTTLVGVYFAMRYSLGEQLRLLAWALGIATLLSLFFALALPSYGIFSGAYAGYWEGVVYEGSWQGIFVHKNTLGSIMALSALVFLLLAMGEYRYRVILWAGFCLSVCLLVLSNSKTALATFLPLLILLPLYSALRWSYRLAVPVFVASVLLGGGMALWLLGNVGFVLGVLGRDITFTGRTEVWAAVLDMIRENPWLGYGYNAFWLGWTGESAYVWLTVLYTPTHAHNGFLDLWLDLGLLGVLVFALGFLSSTLRTITRTRLARSAEDLWPLTFLTFMLLYNMFESAILARNSIFWVLYVTVALSVFGRRRQTLENVSYHSINDKATPIKHVERSRR